MISLLEIPRCYSRRHAEGIGDLVYWGNPCRKSPNHRAVRVTSNGGCADCQASRTLNPGRWKRIALPAAISDVQRKQLNRLSVDGTIGRMLFDLLTMFPGDEK